MKETKVQCDKCRHNFHAKAPCVGYDDRGGCNCKCEGSWPTETRQISGYCYILTGTSRERARLAHEACPGKEYPYPCECDCHEDSFTLRPLTRLPAHRILES